MSFVVVVKRDDAGRQRRESKWREPADGRASVVNFGGKIVVRRKQETIGLRR
jgi:hypothetical protein